MNSFVAYIGLGNYMKSQDQSQQWANHEKLFGTGQDTVARFPKFDNQPRRVNKSNLIILNMYF